MSKDYSLIFFSLELENICAHIYMVMLKIGIPCAQGTLLSGCVTFIVDKRNRQQNKRTKLKLQEKICKTPLLTTDICQHADKL